MASMEVTRNAFRVFGKPEEKHPLEELCIDSITILKWRIK
jgi:hypothetical protein